MSSFNTIVKTFKNVKGKTIDVYGCWDKLSDYEKGKRPQFYDVYDELGTCLNEGDPYFRKPTKSELIDLVESFDL